MARLGNYIPEDLILKILLDLPVKALSKFRCVSKRWRSLIDDPCFVYNHHVRSYNRPGGIKFLMAGGGGRQEFMLVDLAGNTSPVRDTHPAVRYFRHSHLREIGVEGLICIGDVVCNPSTEKSIHLPPLKVHLQSRFNKPMFVKKFYLGFDALTKQYKVLSIYQTALGRGYMDYDNPVPDELMCKGEFKIQIFTLGTTSWRDITHHIPNAERRHMDMVHLGTYMYQASLYLKNKIYFLLRYPHFYSLMVFSVGDETFKFRRLPNSIEVNRRWVLIEVNECVALLGPGAMEGTPAGGMEGIWILTDFDTGKWDKITPPSWLRNDYAPTFQTENTVICAINSTELLVQSKSTEIVECEWKRKREHCFIGDVKSKRTRMGPNLEGIQFAEIHSKYVEILLDPTVLQA